MASPLGKLAVCSSTRRATRLGRGQSIPSFKMLLSTTPPMTDPSTRTKDGGRQCRLIRASFTSRGGESADNAFFRNRRSQTKGRGVYGFFKDRRHQAACSNVSLPHIVRMRYLRGSECFLHLTHNAVKAAETSAIAVGYSRFSNSIIIATVATTATVVFTFSIAIPI